MPHATLALMLAATVLWAPYAAAAAPPQRLAVLPAQFDASSKGKVPKIFNDYLLAAVQNAGNYEVIGQDDISTLLGFEKQKDLVDCSDTSCIADIGGALGVDKIVAVKIARLKDDWVCTAKLIDIKHTRVDGRATTFIAGDVKALLEGVPTLARKLFQSVATDNRASTPASSTTSASDLTSQPPPAAQSTKPAQPKGEKVASVPKGSHAPTITRNDHFGRGRRLVGTLLLYGGVAFSAVGGLLYALGSSCSSSLYYDPTTCAGLSSTDPSLMAGATLSLVVGLVLEGIGSKVHATGAARAELGNDDATGHPAVYWLGWVLAGATLLAPVYGFSTNDSQVSTIWGWGTGLATTAVFVIGTYAYHAELAGMPLPTMHLARGPSGQRLPTWGLAMRF